MLFSAADARLVTGLTPGSGGQRWVHEADALVQRSDRPAAPGQASRPRSGWLAEMTPDRQLVRPLLVVVPADHRCRADRAASREVGR